MQKTFTFLALCICFALILGTSRLALAQQTQNVSRISLTEALQTIEKQYKTRFAYEHGLLNDKFTTRQQLKGNSVEEVLKNVLYPNNLIFLYVSENTYSIVARKADFFTGVAGNQPIQTPANGVAGKQSTLRGTVYNSRNEPIAYANVWLKGTNQATRTNDDGGYLLPSVKQGDVIVFDAIGYFKLEAPASFQQSKLDVTLVSNGTTLDEVTVVSNGYQALPKERTTGSAATVTAKEIEEHPQTNLLARLEGLAPGVQINLTSGDRGFFYQSGGSIATVPSVNGGTRTVGINDYTLNVRGRNSLQGEQAPLIVLDGAITELDMSTLNPNDIENVTFLKDAAAASIWGVRAANGVIVINTKKGKRTQTPTVNISSIFTFGEKPDLGYYKMMNSAQVLNYEKELVDRNILTPIAPSNYFNAIYVVPEGTQLAQQLKAGTITQAQYDSRISQLSAIDNRSQVNKYFLQSMQNQQYNLSVSGGAENSTYYYSASYSRERPNQVNNYGSRLTTTLNNSWKLFNRVTLSTSFKGSFFKFVNNGLSLQNLYRPDRFTLLPYQQVADANGNGISYDRISPDFTKTLSSAYKDWRYNYLDELSYGDNSQKDNNYIFNASLKAPLFAGLSASVIYTNERTFDTQRTFYDPKSYYIRDMLNYYTYPTATSNSLGITTGGGLTQINTNQSNYSMRGQLEFDRNFASKHQVTALAGTEIRETNIGAGTYSLWGYNMATGITNNTINLTTNPTYAYIAGATPTSYTSFNKGGYPTQADKRRRFLSYYGNVAYAYNNKYVLTGSVRYDDYNNFGLDRKYRATPLWSTGLKWNLSREGFLKNVAWLTSAALRATYGVNGNLSLTNYPYTYISLGSSDATTGQSYASVIALANPQLRWEKTYVKNLGIDFSLFSSRLNGSFEVYSKKSKDLLYSFPISSVYTGNISTTLTRNAASLEGKGAEFGLNGAIINKKDWSLSAGMTFAYNTNKLTDNRFIESLYTSNFGTSPTSIGPISGYAADKLFVYRNAGLDAGGLTQIYDRNGAIVKATTTTLSSLSDLKYAGRTIAPYFGGFNTTLRYKQFSLFAQTSYQFGSVFLKPSIQNYITTATFSTAGYYLGEDIAKRWAKPGDEATTAVPGINGTANAVQISLIRYQNSDINVLKGDYVRLRQLTLSYQVPGQILSKYKIKGINIGASANNLGLIWRANKEGYDPDFTSYIGSVRGLPAARSYSLNVNLNF
ncbi:SusC/RagA family TonB-linked outer membrane protein [Mucilaginibacter terrae]|uniref:TonB-linked SusC/RagA family outer membrane protein n=1 Tax=Mucilaginibacter terrae TaxID=1955052 RepID=A0ABU3GUZ1_9SPHI|nr:SusC/RagA family TonB-linked outer membrane protein [Mucilaginibacter terrae]MDT3403594.1 TonB-linked SusC/RagA family outer membrane protein [Mucilaginibacter terrae]